MRRKFKNLEKKQLLRKLDELSSRPSLYERPSEGWIRTLRKALGMTSSQLAKRLNIGQPRVSEIEKAEIQDQLTLKTLIAVAQALGCRFEYEFIPEKPISEFLKERAFQVASEKVNYISHHMALENQALTEEEKKDQIKQIAEELINTPQKLWDS